MKTVQQRGRLSSHFHQIYGNMPACPVITILLLLIIIMMTTSTAAAETPSPIDFLSTKAALSAKNGQQPSSPRFTGLDPTTFAEVRNAVHVAPGKADGDPDLDSPSSLQGQRGGWSDSSRRRVSSSEAGGAFSSLFHHEIDSQKYFRNVNIVDFTSGEEEKVVQIRSRFKRNALITASCPLGTFECAADATLCVPQNAICNGKPDCPDGSDEDQCENKHDKQFWDNFFQKRPGADAGKNDTCKYPTLKKTEEHDKHPEEESSKLPSESECQCSGEKLFCHNLHHLNLSLIPDGVIFLDLSGSGVDSVDFTGEGTRFHQLNTLDLRHNKLKFVTTDQKSPTYFLGLSSLRILHLSNNELEFLGPDYFLGLENLELLSLTRNKISSISRNAFANLSSLIHLYLAYNRLESLEDERFCSLRSLLNLNLNNNGIKHISPDSFVCLDSLQSLVLEQNRFGELENPSRIFANLTELQYIYFDQFWMCAWAPHVRSCTPKGDGISSVENLLDNVILRVCVWIMGIVGVVGNGFVILSRLLVREKNRVHSFYIKNLAFADLIMGLFLLSIAYHDVLFRGNFLSQQHTWRHSLTCQWSGLLSTLSSESSVLILTLITLDRYLSIIKPFSERRNAMLPAISVISVLWTVSFLLSFVPLYSLFEGYFGPYFYTSNGLCLPLNIHNPFDSGWEYSFFLFVVINSFAFAFICYAYYKMLRIIQTSTTSIRSTQQKQDGMLAMRFGIVVLTDFLCWAPVIVSKTLAMLGVPIQSDFYAWLAVFVLPVNSAINPIIYTLTTKLFKQQVSHLTLGVRKRLGMATDDSTTSSLYYRNRISRTLNTSLSGSIMHSTKGPPNGSVTTRHQARNRNRYTVSAINSVIASSTGIQLPAGGGGGGGAGDSSISEDDGGYLNGAGGGPAVGQHFSLQTLREDDDVDNVEMCDPSGLPPYFTDIDLTSHTNQEEETVT
ncbi:Relaxin receptor 1 [Folsomia candida]|uniref:Relaxin receptor 1 n=1 Tax=Folsomia candida TaxID=158441 RepID=A0A226ES75_FOLCA|nr:Relaxin receptor 1 [Folsomia candida]